MKIGILGASTMGIGLIQICAQHGFEVVYRARRQESVNAAKDKVLGNYEFMISNGWLTPEERDASMARITGSTDIELLKDADFVIEAASENMGTKKELFRQLDEMCRPEVILATNTSSLSVTEIASVTKRDDKVIGMHFFNPAPVMKLVEMIPGYNTSQETIDFAVDMAKKLQKTPNAGSYDQRGGIRISGRAGESGRYRPGDETGSESSDGTSRFGGSGGSGYLPFDHGRII